MFIQNNDNRGVVRVFGLTDGFLIKKIIKWTDDWFYKDDQ